MTDLISRYEVVGKLKKAYFDKNLQEAKNDPCVIDAMTDWAIRQVKDTPSYSPWHTGKPTEEGWYVCKMRGVDIYETNYFTGMDWEEHLIEKWQKIEEKEK